MAVMSSDFDPGERRLAKPPSDRYPAIDPEAATVPSAAAGSLLRGVLYGAIAAFGGVLATILLGGVMALSAGLLVVWASAGNAIGLATRIGSGLAVARSTRIGIAAGLALTGAALGQLGLWWYAGTEGGVLPLLSYLGETFGILVPLQALLAVGFAWWAAR